MPNVQLGTVAEQDQKEKAATLTVVGTQTYLTPLLSDDKAFQPQLHSARRAQKLPSIWARSK